MTKEVRAVVLGLAVIVVVALALSIWRRPGAVFRRIKGFRVEIKKTDAGETRSLSVNVPVALLGHVARLSHVESLGGGIKINWGKGDITPKKILDAVDQSSPGKPGVIKNDDSTTEVTADGSTLVIDVKDEWNKKLHVRLPRTIVEALAGDQAISTQEILRRLDELGPGDVVTFKDEDTEVTITAQPRRGLNIS